MRGELAQIISAFLVQEDRLWRRVRAHWFLAIAYVGAFIAVGYFLPIVLDTIEATSGTAELTTGWGFLRAVTTLLVIIGALVLMLPVAWVYTVTRPNQYDPSLVQSLVILPIVAAGIVIVVKDSLALAFGLAGIVAAVQFRNSLKDPKDAVYIFLALAVGVASGVGALDVALVLSASFNAVVLFLWRYNIKNIYAGCYLPKDKHARGRDTAALHLAAGTTESGGSGPMDASLTTTPAARKHAQPGILTIRVPTTAYETAKQTIEELLDKRHVLWSATATTDPQDGNEITLRYSVSRPGGEKRKRLLRMVEKVGAPHVIEAHYVQNGKALRKERRD